MSFDAMPATAGHRRHAMRAAPAFLMFNDVTIYRFRHRMDHFRCHYYRSGLILIDRRSAFDQMYRQMPEGRSMYRLPSRRPPTFTPSFHTMPACRSCTMQDHLYRHTIDFDELKRYRTRRNVQHPPPSARLRPISADEQLPRPTQRPRDFRHIAPTRAPRRRRYHITTAIRAPRYIFNAAARDEEGWPAGQATSSFRQLAYHPYIYVIVMSYSSIYNMPCICRYIYVICLA